MNHIFGYHPSTPFVIIWQTPSPLRAMSSFFKVLLSIMYSLGQYINHYIQVSMKYINMQTVLQSPPPGLRQFTVSVHQPGGRRDRERWGGHQEAVRRVAAGGDQSTLTSLTSLRLSHHIFGSPSLALSAIVHRGSYHWGAASRQRNWTSWFNCKLKFVVVPSGMITSCPKLNWTGGMLTVQPV